MSLRRDDVTPIPKPVKRERAPKRGLPKVGKKMKRDREELAETRKVLLERSGGRCEARVSKLCTGHGTIVHHVTRRAQSGPNDPDNCLLVDMFCHDVLHNNPAMANELGMIRRYSNASPEDVA